MALREPGALAGIPGWPPRFPLSPCIRGRHFLLPGPAGQASTQMESPTQGPPKESSPWKRHGARARHGARGCWQAFRGPGAPVRVLSSFLSLSFLDSAPLGSEFCSDKMSKYSNPGKVSRGGDHRTEARSPTPPAMTRAQPGQRGDTAGEVSPELLSSGVSFPNRVPRLCKLGPQKKGWFLRSKPSEEPPPPLQDRLALSGPVWKKSMYCTDQARGEGS